MDGARSALEQIETIADIPIDVVVELDGRVLTVKEIMDLRQGSVVRLTRSAGENIDVLIGGALACFGEIVIIEDTIGVRITDFNVEE